MRTCTIKTDLKRSNNNSELKSYLLIQGENFELFDKFFFVYKFIAKSPTKMSDERTQCQFPIELQHF